MQGIETPATNLQAGAVAEAPKLFLLGAVSVAFRYIWRWFRKVAH